MASAEPCESSPFVIEKQPKRYSSELDPIAPGNHGSCPVTIRNLRDTKADSELAGSLTVEARRQYYVHATSEGSIPDMVRYASLEHRGQQPVFYQRKFVAEYNGQAVGILAIRIHDDPEKRSLDENELATVGCYDACGLACLGSEIQEQVAEDSCYVELVAVENAFQGKGVGKLLMDKAECEAQQLGTKIVYLHVDSTNSKARQFFSHNGYVVKEKRCCCIWCTTGACMMIKMEKTVMK